MDVAEVLSERWDLEPVRLEVLTGGMNSTAWLAAADGWRVVLKSVDAGDSAFAPGLELAARLDDAGVITGRPRPSTRGRLVEYVEDRQIAVLEYVDGVPLTSADAAAIGTVLGRVHTVSAAEPGNLDDWLHLVTQFDKYLDLEPWIRPAVEGALDGVKVLDGLSWAWLHGDPSAEAFLRQSNGEVALIDWGSAMYAPILYDVASAVMYTGKPDHLVPAYLDRRPNLAAELERGLTPFLHLRWAVQAAYFAWRCTQDIRTGITNPAENHKGLSDARRSFESA
ncbi:phosphotransferase [Kribbella sp. NPDC051952]|uniref:phosphotransferase enzyme family protein n=1 Tax=Kribbella sp. NPDC051952 TaxID=3154851 RepID=UPI00341DC9CE